MLQKKCEDLQQGMEQHRTTDRGERIKHCIQDGASDEGNLDTPCSVWRTRREFPDLANPEEGPGDNVALFSDK